MGTLGNPLPLDQRRALAAGELARGQYSFLHHYNHAAPEIVEPELVAQRTPSRVPAETTETAGDSKATESVEATEGAQSVDAAGARSDANTITMGQVTAANPVPGRFGRRDLVLYAHLPTDTLTGTTQTADTEAGTGSPTNP